MHIHRRLQTTAAAASFLFLAGACTDRVTNSSDRALLSLDGDTYFVRQVQEPDAVMEALFQGQVVEDKGGCLRLQGPSPSTVVWPFGSTLEPRSDGDRVLDGEGNELGRIGGVFRFGGGHVPFLHEGLGFSKADVTRIQARCPGRFWIVGEILGP